ncbi:succinyl-Coa ligase, subunit [Babesia caballi]|uniref:Succinyl-Coa ligase, subunit n=1 Tax=Babesia caballi TaxID=5871 RepID=A0AAV4LPC4_BABCB|nr:succinyl-Coa ligase, subunit [Babesia caballi]
MKVLREHGIPAPMNLLARSPAEAEAMTREILETTKCKEVVVAEKLTLAKERYISFMLDRASSSVMAIATKHGGGNVACIVNGAGLAMATLDLLTHHGGTPANFLDVGGNATGAMLNQALDIVASDANAKVLLVNIVGGIVQCDKFATSFVEAAKASKMKMPVVMRLQGTKAEVAKKILHEAQIPHIFCQEFDMAARSAVEIANAA